MARQTRGIHLGRFAADDLDEGGSIAQTGPFQLRRLVGKSPFVISINGTTERVGREDLARRWKEFDIFRQHLLLRDRQCRADRRR